MLDSIYVGITGLKGYSDELRTIANNTANINTPGFKSSSLQFADLFYSSGNANSGGGNNYGQMGYGLNTTGTKLNFKQGDMRKTGNDLDVAVDGDGLFILKDANGELHYTRAGQFQFNSSGLLVNSDGAMVMGLDANGNLVPITLDGSKYVKGAATTQVTFTGNLSSGQTDQTLGSIKVVDGAGGEHQLSAKFTNTAAAGAWTVTILDGTTTVGTGTISFVNGKPDPASAKISINYTPQGLGVMPLSFDFSNNVTSFASGNLSTLAVDTQDGFSPGGLTKATFDAAGTLVLTYSNGQTVKGVKLALGRFDSVDAVAAVGGNEFDSTDNRAWHTGAAGTASFGSVHAGMVEISNVDLSQEFSDLVITQRGYQASSQIISSANEMLQELFSMKGK